MGKEWLYRIGGGGSGDGNGRSTKRGKTAKEDLREVAQPSGCMCAVFQLFDLHHFQLPLNQESSAFLDDESPVSLKGVEAPRNSLELDEPSMKAATKSLSLALKQEQDLNIPVNIQIRTSCDNKSPRVSTSTSRTRTDDLSSSECSNSPGTKTPNLVARLMGLDLLPECNSPSLSSSKPIPKPHLNIQISSQKQPHSAPRHRIQTRSSHSRSFCDEDFLTARSLPETPRMSSSRRSDVDHHHRLSLQVNKENIGEELEKIMRKREFRQEDENRSPGHYARQKVKQVKENVSRRVGLDITNTIKNKEVRRDEHLVLLKPKNPSKIHEESNPGKQLTPSRSSPKIRFLETKSKQIQTSNKSHCSQLPLSPLSPIAVDQRAPSKCIEVQEQNVGNGSQKWRKFGGEKLNSKGKKPPQVCDAIRNKKEETFVRSTTNKASHISEKKCRKTPLSNELLNVNVSNFIPVKKEPSPPATRLPQKQAQVSVSDALSSKRNTQLSSCASHSYKPNVAQTHSTSIQDKSNGVATSSSSSDGGAVVAEEYQYYIQRILKRTGLDKSIPVSLAKWYSSSHPLDPSIFYYVELFYFHPAMTNVVHLPRELNLRCNRRLIFHLVDELLVNILRPYVDFKLWTRTLMKHNYQLFGSELISILCERVQGFPMANCQVLEDIDTLIDGDLSKKSESNVAFVEEGERIVKEIEHGIMDSLVHEILRDLVFGTGHETHVRTVRRVGRACHMSHGSFT